MDESLRIMLADDHRIFRKGVAGVLNSHQGLTLIGEANDGLEAVEMAGELKPDLIIMDINMPRLNGLDAIKQIKQMLPDTKIVVLTVSEDSEDLFKAIKYGAQGYLIKNLKEYQLIDMIEDAARGEACFSGIVASKILQEFENPARKDTTEKETGKMLTQREKEVLSLLVKGLSNKEIGDAMHITSGTVKNHLTNILDKLHLKNRLQIAVYAVSKGLVEDTSFPDYDKPQGQLPHPGD